MKIKKALFIFIFLVLCSILASYPMLKPGFIGSTHDGTFLYSQLLDLDNTFSNYKKFSYISHDVLHNLGYGTRILYAPLSQMLVVGLKNLFSFMNLNLIGSLKIVYFMSFIISGIGMYKLTYYLTKNTFSSLIAACVFIFFPYRLTDIYIRNALSETIAFVYIPYIFYGFLKILDSSEFRFKDYTILMVSFSLLLLTHNITALYTLVFVLILSFFNIKKIFKLIVHKQRLVKSLVCIILTIMLCSIYLIPVMQHQSLGIYRVFNQGIMGATLEGIKGSVTWGYGMLWAGSSNLVIDIFNRLIFPIVFCGLLFTYVTLIYKSHYKILFHFLILLFFLCYTYSLYQKNIPNLEIKLFIILLVCCLLYYSYHRKKEDKIKHWRFFSFLILFVISLIPTLIKDVWDYIPSVFYNIQFSMRIFIFVAVFFCILLAYLTSTLKKYSYGIVGFALCLLILISESISGQNTSDNINKWDEHLAIDEKYYYWNGTAGWQFEYLPESIYSYDFPSTSKLHDDIRNAIRWGNFYGVAFEPLILNATKFDSLSVTLKNTPYISFDVHLEDTKTIHIPLVYYLGYQVTHISSDGKKEIIPYYNLGGLMAIDVEHSGAIIIDYVKTKEMKLSTILCYFASVTICVILTYEFIKKNKFVK